jgi:outer membrane biosynthesis protein TonB
VNKSILEQELAPLEAQIERVGQKLEALKRESRAVEGELSAFSADKERFDALSEVCDALGRLGEIQADGLFWDEIPGAGDRAGLLEKVRARVAGFEEETREVVEKQRSVQEQINQCLDELYILDEEIRGAYDREERRSEEFIVEREMSSIPYRAAVMPWSREAESERRLRRAVLGALFISLAFGLLIPLVNVPMPDRSDMVSEIPKRLVQLVKKDLPKPAPVPKPEPLPAPKPEQVEEEIKQAKPEPDPQVEAPEPKAEETKAAEQPKDQKTVKQPEDKPTRMAAADGGASAARDRAERVGVLKFKNAFKDLMTEAPVARLGTEASLSNGSPQAKGQAVARRSLVAIQAEGGSSGGIGAAGVSRNIGNGNVSRLGSGGGDGQGGGEGFGRVESSIAGLEGSSRPTSDGLAPGRTDEEIQIVFDRYKAALYRIYNRELRKDPTLRGKILMRISIEPDGAVSLCQMESTDLGSPELVARIVERIRRFNFGPKEGVQKMTILYPIDFLPAA